MSKMAKIAAYRPMLIQATIFDAVTNPPPVTQPLLAAISLSALFAKTKATIAGMIGQMTQDTIESTKATIAEFDVCGTGP